MPLEFKADRRYRMPVFFGPSAGPRHGPNGEVFNYDQAPRKVATVSFLTDAAMLGALLPPGYTLDGEPVVSVDHSILTDLPWLAGRGYNVLGVRFPARFDGTRDHVRGPLLLVCWEDLTDAILTGREELGFSKLFADLPLPEVDGPSMKYEASWQGHRFATMELTDLVDATPPGPPVTPLDGVLHYRYFPAVNNDGHHDVGTPAMTPMGGAKITMQKFQTGKGRVSFVKTTWEQMPTQFHIINGIAALPILEERSAVYTETLGAKDLSDQRLLV